MIAQARGDPRGHSREVICRRSFTATEGPREARMPAHSVRSVTWGCNIREDSRERDRNAGKGKGDGTGIERGDAAEREAMVASSGPRVN